MRGVWLDFDQPAIFNHIDRAAARATERAVSDNFSSSHANHHSARALRKHALRGGIAEFGNVVILSLDPPFFINGVRPLCLARQCPAPCRTALASPPWPAELECLRACGEPQSPGCA